MTADLWALVAAILLASVQLTLSSVLAPASAGRSLVAGNHRTARGDGCQRLVRAHRNLLEFPAVRRRTVPGACS